jgi:glycosyltransferase involved in cell wall biosynthesis
MEIVVVDDASTDGTRDILEGYGSSIRLIQRDVNSGLPAITRNQAARAARGSYIAFLDSDDVWHADKTTRQMDFMASHPEIPLSHTLVNILDEHSHIMGIRHGINVVPPTGMIFESLLEHCWITMSSVLVRRSLFDTVGWFDESPRIGIIGEEDLNFFLRVARMYPIGLVAEALAGYRKSSAGISTKLWRATPEAQSFLEVLLNDRALWEGVVSRRRVVEAHTRACLENAAHWRDRGDTKRSLYFSCRGLRYQPFNLHLWDTLGRTFFRRIFPRTG